jgi:hypothetical protein
LTNRNGKKDGDETDIDCGGSSPLRCSLGSGCSKSSDCSTTTAATCLAGTCNQATIGVVMANPRMYEPDGLVNAVTIRTLLPLPADATITYAVQKPNSQFVSLAFTPLPVTSPVGRDALFKVTKTALNPGQGTSVLIEATIAGNGAQPVTLTQSTNLAMDRLFVGGAVSIAQIRSGPCSSAGPVLPESNGVTDVPIGSTVCTTFAGLPSVPQSAQLAGAYGTAVGNEFEFTVDGKTPLFEGFPAVAPVDLTIAYSTGRITSFAKAVRFTALQLSGTGSPTGLGTPANPRKATLAELAAATSLVAHVQIQGTIPVTESVSFFGRVQGDGTATLLHTAVGKTITLANGARLDDLVVSAEGLPPGPSAPCVETTSSSSPTLRGVEIKGCTTGLFVRGDATIVGGSFRQNGLSLQVGDPQNTGQQARVVALGTTFANAGVALASTQATVDLRQTTISDSNPALSLGSSSKLTLVGGALVNNGTGLSTTGSDHTVLLADVDVLGNGATEAIGLRGQSTFGSTTEARNVRFDGLGKHALLLEGRDDVELVFSAISTSGDASHAAVDVSGGRLRLVGGVVRDAQGTGIHVGDNTLAGTKGELSLVAGAEIVGGTRGLVSDGESKLQLRDARIRSASVQGLVLASSAPFDLQRSYIVSDAPRTGGPLLLVDRPLPPAGADTIASVHLQAGNGAELVSGSGGPCGPIDDATGGAYVGLVPGTTFCF